MLLSFLVARPEGRRGLDASVRSWASFVYVAPGRGKEHAPLAVDRGPSGARLRLVCLVRREKARVISICAAILEAGRWQIFWILAVVHPNGAGTLLFFVRMELERCRYRLIKMF